MKGTTLFKLCSVLLINAMVSAAVITLGATDPLATMAAITAFNALTGLVPLPGGSLMTVANLGNVLYDGGADNMGGLRTQAYYCLHSEVLTHSTPPSREDATTLEELVTLSADHTFKSGKGWKKLYNTEDTGMVESTIQGEKDGKSFLNKIKLFYPKAGATAMGFIRFIVNAGLYAVGVDAEGVKRMVGSKHYPAKLDTGSISTTETAAGRKGITFDLICSAPHPALIMDAALVIESDDVGSGSGTA